MSEKIYDVLIAGGGPAGLCAAQYAARAGLEVFVFEGMAGGQAAQISELENFPGVFPAVSGYDFCQKMKGQAKSFGAQFSIHECAKIERQNGMFCVQTADGDFCAPAFILATGCVPRKLEIPGEEEFFGRGVSYCATCDGPFFRGKKVIVIGGGDSAFEEARFLSNIASNVVLTHRRDEFRAQKSIVERVLQNEKIAVKKNMIPTRIFGNGKTEGAEFKDAQTGEIVRIEADGVFIFAGLVPQTQLLPNGIEKSEAGFVKTDAEMATAIPGFFCAGDIREKSFRQIVTACSDGAIAAHSAARFLEKSR